MTDSFVRAADLDDLLPGTARVVRVQGRSVALFRVGDDVYALENACPHRDGPLGEGALDGKIVTCPRHGWQFDVTTGQCVGRPGRTAAAIETRVERGEIQVQLAPQLPSDSDTAGTAEALVRFGAMGYVGRFHSSAAYARGARVVVQSSRGIELGEVLWNGREESEVIESQPLSGAIVRECTDADTVQAAVQRHRVRSAFQTCCEVLERLKVPVELIEAEQLFDGETIVFYFLGDPPAVLADVTAELTGRLASHIQFRPFGDQLHESCDNCGHGGDHGCGNCSETGGCNSGQVQ